MIIITNPGMFVASDPFGCLEIWLKVANMFRFPLPAPSKLKLAFFFFFFLEPHGLEGI